MPSTSVLVASKTRLRVAVTWARFASSAPLAPSLPSWTAAPAALRSAASPPMAVVPAVAAWALAAPRVWSSLARIWGGAAAAWASPAFLASRAAVKVGSLERASWPSVTWASAISLLTWAGPAERSVADGGALSGMALAGSGVPGVGGGWSEASGVTGFSLAAAVSGGALVVVVIWLADAFLPSVTWPWTAPLTAPALPESAKWSASSRFFGAWAAIALLTAAMKAALSNAPGWAAFIFS